MNGKPVNTIINLKRAVLFDLFHTLVTVRTGGRHGSSTTTILGVKKEDWTEQLLEKSRERLTGEMTDEIEIIRKMAHALDPDISEDTILRAAKNRRLKFEDALINVSGDVIEVLKRLRDAGKKIGLVSNADLQECAAWDSSPLAPCFDAAVFCSHVGHVKPEREIYEIAMQRLGAAAHECVFIGDGGSDELRGARGLGISTIMITGIIKDIWPGRIEGRKRDADFVIENLNELL